MFNVKLFYKLSVVLIVLVLVGVNYTSTEALAAPALNNRAVSQASNAPLPGYTKLIFQDDFNTFNPVWHSGEWWTREGNMSTEENNEQEAYAPANVTVQNGMLNITAKKQTVSVEGTTYGYTSGLVETGGDQYGYANKFTFQYGYMEARIKIPAGQGLWPAFWSWPANFQDPPETDFMEILGNNPQADYMTVHYTGGSKQYVLNSVNLSKNFHIYGCEWTSTYIAWFVDGVQVARFSNATLVSHQPMYLILNLAVGGDWPGAVSDSVLPATMQVDWVRVYQKK